MLSNRLMKRIHKNYRFIVTFNAGLILLGVAAFYSQPLPHCFTIHLLFTLA